MEKLQYLGQKMKIYVTECHRYGTDAVLLADFAMPKKGERACDLGTGCGIIPLMWRLNGSDSDNTPRDHRQPHHPRRRHQRAGVRACPPLG